MSSKDLIRQSFDKADHYDDHAQVQNRIADMLCERLGDLTPKTILEIGCGTGFLSQNLVQKFPHASFTFTDISSEMLKRTQQKLGNRHTYIEMDGEAPNLPEKYDLILSSMTFQWFDDVQGALSTLKKYLNPNGEILFSMMGSQSFAEWHNAHQTHSLTPGTPKLPNANLLHNVDTEEAFMPEKYKNAKDFVKSVKAIGAGAAKPNHQPLSSKEMKKVLKTFEEVYNSTATYHIIFGRIS